MELQSFEEFTGVKYVGIEPTWLCHNWSCWKERCKAIEKARQYRDLEHPEIVMKANGIPEHFLKCSFENYHDKEKAVNACRDHDMKISLYIYGGAGRGKTHILSSFARELVKRGYYDFLFISAARLFELLANAAFRRDGQKGTEHDIVERYSQTGILFLDDLGQHGASNWIISKLYLIIDHRYSNDLLTIITSNFNLNDLQDKLGEPIASRIAAGKIFCVTGSDYRRRRKTRDTPDQS